MNKLPAKQIYLLSIIVLGIITLSVYSTYSIFTLEAESSDIVSIHTPNSLSVDSSSYEYKQVTVPKNSYISTDIDIYNNLDYPLCYSVWYKIASKNIDTTKVRIFENTDSSIITSSTIEPVTSRRINLIIINDNDSDVKVNVGLSHAENEGTCELNLTTDKSMVVDTINNARTLSDSLIKGTTEKDNEAGYLTYKDNTNEIKFNGETKIYVANKFTYNDELFTLTESKEINRSELNQYIGNYMCIDNDNCRILYYIKEVNDDGEDGNIKYYKVTKYDRLIGYLGGKVGLRKVPSGSDNNFYFYGDNPNNFVYYNCKNEKDVNTCELWRIIGFTHNKENNKYITKLIRNDYIGAHEYDDDMNSWNESKISKYLKEYELNNKDILTEITFKEENVIDLDSKLNSIPLLDGEYKTNISLINLSDYLYTSSCTKDKINEYDENCLNNNWLNKNGYISEWTMTKKQEEPYEDEETEELITPENDKLYSVGSSILESKYDENLYVRPVIYLKSRVLITGGDGSLDNPYIIK